MPPGTLILDSLANVSKADGTVILGNEGPNLWGELARRSWDRGMALAWASTTRALGSESSTKIPGAITSK